jgi:hypothetical protein
MVSLYSFYTADHLDGVQGTDRADLSTLTDRVTETTNKPPPHSLSFFLLLLFLFFVLSFLFNLFIFPFFFIIFFSFSTQSWSNVTSVQNMLHDGWPVISAVTPV